MTRMAMSKLFTLSLLALALAGCATTDKTTAPGPAAASTGLNPQADRITDTRIAADRDTLDRVQLRLRHLSEAGVAQNNYSLAKAQCWLDTANTQYYENDRTGYIEESLAESMKIIQALESDKNAKAGYTTPLVAHSSRLRDDLWSQFDAYKNMPATLACTAHTVACGEVRLVRAGHAEQQTGWRAATPHVQMAEDALRRAGVEAAQCAPAVVAVPAPVAPPVVAAPTPAPTTVTVVKETFVLLADAMFSFDRSKAEDMMPGGRAKLAAVAERLKGYKSIESIKVIGHTDRIGSDEYNDKLSLARAQTIKDQLLGFGVKANNFSVEGAGKRQPVTTNCSDSLAQAALIQCLQPDRRVTLEDVGVAK